MAGGGRPRRLCVGRRRRGADAALPRASDRLRDAADQPVRAGQWGRGSRRDRRRTLRRHVAALRAGRPRPRRRVPHRELHAETLADLDLRAAGRHPHRPRALRRAAFRRLRAALAMAVRPRRTLHAFRPTVADRARPRRPPSSQRGLPLRRGRHRRQRHLAALPGRPGRHRADRRHLPPRTRVAGQRPLHGGARARPARHGGRRLAGRLHLRPRGARRHDGAARRRRPLNRRRPPRRRPREARKEAPQALRFEARPCRLHLCGRARAGAHDSLRGSRGSPTGAATPSSRCAGCCSPRATSTRRGTCSSAGAGAVDGGMLPNRFPDSGAAPEFNGRRRVAVVRRGGPRRARRLRGRGQAPAGERRAETARRRRGDPRRLQPRHALQHRHGTRTG